MHAEHSDGKSRTCEGPSALTAVQACTRTLFGGSCVHAPTLVIVARSVSAPQPRGVLC